MQHFIHTTEFIKKIIPKQLRLQIDWKKSEQKCLENGTWNYAYVLCKRTTASFQYPWKRHYNHIWRWKSLVWLLFTAQKLCNDIWSTLASITLCMQFIFSLDRQAFFWFLPLIRELSPSKVNFFHLTLNIWNGCGVVNLQPFPNSIYRKKEITSIHELCTVAV